MVTNETGLHVCLIAIPDGVVSTLGGILDVLNGFSAVATIEDSVPTNPFTVEIVGVDSGQVELASGLPVTPSRSITELRSTDIVIVPSLLVQGPEWVTGRYGELTRWLTEMEQDGALLCSACSGLFLLAETGLFDGHASSIHWSYAPKFRRTFPDIPLVPERPLVVSGDRSQFVTSGASTSWHDLVLYLITRFVGPASALAISRFYALEWHRDGIGPYIVFAPPRDHGDSVIAEAQSWLDKNFPTGSPVEEMIRRSGVAERTFKRRFSSATGYSPIAYVQNLRVEKAKRLLESTDTNVEEIGWQVGYEDPAFFRRLFKRTTDMTPAAYRKKFMLPMASETG